MNNLPDNVRQSIKDKRQHPCQDCDEEIGEFKVNYAKRKGFTAKRCADCADEATRAWHNRNTIQ